MCFVFCVSIRESTWVSTFLKMLCLSRCLEYKLPLKQHNFMSVQCNGGNLNVILSLIAYKSVLLHFSVTYTNPTSNFHMFRLSELPL